MAKFVNSLCKHTNKRLAKEAASQGHMSNDAGEGTANGAVSHIGRQQLSTGTQRRLAQVILRMADKAQYSKVGWLEWLQMYNQYNTVLCDIYYMYSASYVYHTLAYILYSVT